MKASIVVVTYRRPDCVRTCLDHLEQQSTPPCEVIVVDASEGTETRDIALGRERVVYIPYPAGRGHMTSARNVGWKASCGDIVAFIDDDAFAEKDWLTSLLAAYRHSNVGGVGGRALTPGKRPPDGNVPIGRLCENGLLTGNFDADPGRPVPVDHLIGCNMSFRRDVLEQIGGLYDRYPGTELREDTDASMSVVAAGYQLLFEPKATVLHVGAPHVRGRRFDLRYRYYSTHNHVLLLARHGGLSSRRLWAYMRGETTRGLVEAGRRIGGACLNVGAKQVGLISGLARAVRERVRNRSSE